MSLTSNRDRRAQAREGKLRFSAGVAPPLAERAKLVQAVLRGVGVR